MAKPSTDLLDSLSKDASSKPKSEVTVTIESEPDYETLADAFKTAQKSGNARALCQAVAAMCACCKPGDDMGEDD